MLIKQDKIEHWAFGFVLTLFYLVHPYLGFSGSVFAIGKEMYDAHFGSGWDNNDIWATLTGVLSGIIFLGLIL